MKRRIEVTIEAERTVVAAGGARLTARWCPRCSTSVTFASADVASVLCGVSSRSIYRWIEAGRVHFIESATTLVVCLPSLRMKD